MSRNLPVARIFAGTIELGEALDDADADVPSENSAPPVTTAITTNDAPLRRTRDTSPRLRAPRCELLITPPTLPRAP
jgi:hypothetical protein